MSFGRVICVVVLLAAGQAVAAQQPLDSVQHISEVVVTAQRYREIIPAQKLSGITLERLNSFSVADAIRYFSGVQIKDYGGVGGLKTVDIRSMGTHHIGVFYDGIQLGNAQNGQIDLGKFSLDNIEEVSLYNGQKSEVFQSAKEFGSSGTIYLRTRRPRFLNGETHRLTTVFRSGSFDLINPSILWEQRLSEQLSASLSSEYIHSSGRYKFRYRKLFKDGTVAWDTTAVRRNGDIEAFRIEGALHGFMDRGKWYAKAYYYDSERGIPGAIVNNVWKRSQRQWDRNFFLQGNFQYAFSNKYEAQVSMKYAFDHMRYLNPDTTLLYIDNSFDQQEYYLSVANKYRILPSWDVNLSVDYQWNSLDASLQEFVYPTRNTLLVALASAYEWRRLKIQASLLGTFVFEQTSSSRHEKGSTSTHTPTAQPKDKQEYTPALFLSWQPFRKQPLHLRAFYKRIFRMPTFNDLYYTDIGNISLQPEYTTQYNVGVQFDQPFSGSILQQLSATADVYYNEVDNKIIAVPKGNGQYRWMMMNLGYVEIRGVDVTTKASLLLPYAIRLHASLNYTYQRAEDYSDPSDNDPTAGTYGGQISYIPWHSGSATLHAEWKSVDINYSFIYVGERYHHSSNIRENYEKPWYTHDLTIGKSFRMKRVKARLSAEINNLFDQQYDVVLNYPMPGRHYKVILKIEL